jgi:hypothetical protein
MKDGVWAEEMKESKIWKIPSSSFFITRNFGIENRDLSGIW